MTFPSFPQSSRPLAYTGNKHAKIVPYIDFPRSPNPGDAKPYDIGTIWLNTVLQEAYMLVAKPNNLAIWKQIT